MSNSKLLQPIISFIDLDIRYGDSTILRKLNFNIYKGELLGIIGPSGSGKTSLGRAIMDPDFNVDQNTIYWEGAPWDRSDILQKVGFARQFGGLMSDLTVGENLATLLEYSLGIDHSYALELAMLNMLRFDLAEPTFYQYPHTLSGGMYKKCMICFASIIAQPVILLDEPLSGLDPVAAGKIQSLILSLVPKHTVVCITHQPLPGIDRYLFLSKAGCLMGSIDELEKNPLTAAFMKGFVSHE